MSCEAPRDSEDSEQVYACCFFLMTFKAKTFFRPQLQQIA